MSHHGLFVTNRGHAIGIRRDPENDDSAPLRGRATIVGERRN